MRLPGDGHLSTATAFGTPRRPAATRWCSAPQKSNAARYAEPAPAEDCERHPLRSHSCGIGGVGGAGGAVCSEMGLTEVDPESNSEIRILVAEDMQLLREALVGLLSYEADMTVVAALADGAKIVPTALECLPDVAIIDIGLPGVDGIEAAEELREKLPACRVLILTALTGPGQLRMALRAQVAGFLPKDVG